MPYYQPPGISVDQGNSPLGYASSLNFADLVRTVTVDDMDRNNISLMMSLVGCSIIPRDVSTKDASFSR